MVQKKIETLVIGIVLLVVLVLILAGVTPIVLTALDNLSEALIVGSGNITNPNGVAIGSLLATDSLGGILWFLLALLIVMGTIFLMIRGAGGSGK